MQCSDSLLGISKSAMKIKRQRSVYHLREKMKRVLNQSQIHSGEAGGVVGKPLSRVLSELLSGTFGGFMSSIESLAKRF